MSKYKINVITLIGRQLVFHIDEYKIIEGSFIEFLDKITGKVKRFHSSNVEIEELTQ